MFYLKLLYAATAFVSFFYFYDRAYNPDAPNQTRDILLSIVSAGFASVLWLPIGLGKVFFAE